MATQTSNFIRSLNRIDPTQGLVEYVQATKPYHTKILDVLVEYVYAENLNVTITEDLKWQMYLSRPDVDVAYACGYGFVWDPLALQTDPDGQATPLTIISAQGAVGYPTPNYEKSNSFLIQPASYVPFNIVVSSTQSNQLAFTKNYTITDKNPVIVNPLFTNTWEMDDPLNELVAEISSGDTIFVSSDTGLAGNGRYTVSSLPQHIAGKTYVTVDETIPVQANSDGIFHRVLTTGELPAWIQYTAVTVSSSGALPVPLDSSTQYYFQPTSNVGFFNLSTTRYPSKYQDYVNLTTMGSGTITILRNESFVPGSQLFVDNSLYGSNNGTYTVKHIVPEGAYERVYVYQNVPSSTPLTVSSDGYLKFSDYGFDQPLYCPPAQMGDFHADTYIHESLKFQFEINLFDSIATTYHENDIRGYGETEWGGGANGPYGTGTSPVPFVTTTAMTSGSPNSSPSPAFRDTAHMMLPMGFDTVLFDLGPIDEGFADIRTRNA